MKKDQERCDQCGRWVHDCQLYVSQLDETKSICKKCSLGNARKTNAVASVVGGIAIAALQQTLNDGGTVEIPSLGVVISSENKPTQ